MNQETYKDAAQVARRAAEDAVQTLAQAVQRHGAATWALAGGSSPMAAYAVLAQDYGDALDWSKVTLLIGDERCVPLDHPDSNWGQIAKVLFANASIAKARQLVPAAAQGAETAARLYSELVKDVSIDLLWLGVGEDGHTLSLFPGHPELSDESAPVLPVDNSPKPPPERITLSLQTAAMARKVVIFAVGAAKKEALAKVRQDPLSLPIGMVTHAAAQQGGTLLWLFDSAHPASVGRVV